MNNRTEIKKQKRLGAGAGLLLKLFGKSPRPDSTAELYRKDFHPNTQRMGLRFSERMRNVFRHRWLRQYRERGCFPNVILQSEEKRAANDTK